MPSREKIIYFLACANTTAVSVALLGFAMSRVWAVSRLDCAAFDYTDFNGSATITWELFSGVFEGSGCPFVGNSFDFDVFPQLQASGAPVILQGLVVLFLALCFLCSAGSILIALYNSVSNPYQTYMGPIGVYVCSSLSAVLSVLVLILYAVTITSTVMTETIVLNDAGDIPVRMQNRRAEVRLGYYLVIPYTFLSLGAIALVYFYDHMAYTQRKEKQRPTEDTPKEIMMY